MPDYKQIAIDEIREEAEEAAEQKAAIELLCGAIILLARVRGGLREIDGMLREVL